MNCINNQHKYIKSGETWERCGLWKYLMLTLFCENCGDIIQKELDRK